MNHLLNAYEGSGSAWARGPSILYDRLALRIVQPHAERFGGMLVLDAGAGTGAACRALSRAGALPVALDTSVDMLAQIGDAALVAVAGDICAAPFLDASFGAAISTFAISHVDTPARALTELRRVVKPAGLVVAAVFGTAPPNASKDVIDRVATEHGYVPPPWYVHVKTHTEPLTNTPSALRACGGAAGLGGVNVDDITVDSGMDSADAIVRYRIGMAHLAPFVDSLNPASRERFVDEACAAVGRCGQGLALRVLVLSGDVPA